jgi:hypothetical protein
LIWLPPPLWGRVGAGGKRQRSVLAVHPPPAALRASTAPTRGEVTEKRAEQHSTPPASAGIRPVSCRPRSGQSAAPSDRRGPFPAVPADARGATIRGLRTSAEMFRARERAQENLVRRCPQRQVRPVRPRWSSAGKPDIYRSGAFLTYAPGQQQHPGARAHLPHRPELSLQLACGCELAEIHRQTLVATTTRPGTGVLSSLRADNSPSRDSARPAASIDARK